MRKLLLRALAAAGVVVAALAVVAYVAPTFQDDGPNPTFAGQICGLEDEWRARVQRGYFRPRSGDILILPQTPAYMASGAGGWTHTGPWAYVQRVPLVFYGPGIIPALGEIDRPVTLADVAPTFATMLKGSLNTGDGRSLDEVARLDEGLLEGKRPRLILTVVWDGGGWNALERWPDSWPTLARLMRAGISFTNATVGSSPSVTPPIHTTLGTGAFPWKHGITDIPVRDDNGRVVDAFLEGDSSRFVEIPALAERWDEQNGNEALIGMVGYEPWHLGMIGRGAEKPGGDKDHAAWLDRETNEWITDPDSYELPPALPSTEGLDEDLRELDAADGKADGAWGRQEILDDPSRIEETPAFIEYHARALINMMRTEGYGDDAITDLLFTNFKQIDRVAHFFNMASEEVRDSVAGSDRVLDPLIKFLDEEVGRGKWVMVVTADHGLQPDQDDIDGYGIDPKEVRRDIDERFGDITRAVWPTQVFLLKDKMEEEGVAVEEVARFLSDYRLSDNTKRPDIRLFGAGRFDPGDRLFSMAVPARLVDTVRC